MNPRLLFPTLAAAMAACLAPAAVRAQNLSDVPPPSPPLVAPVPEMADWKVTVVTRGVEPVVPGKPDHSLPRITEVHTTRTGLLRRDVITYHNGTHETHWFVDMMLLWTSRSGDTFANDLHNAPEVPVEDVNPSVPTGFPGLRWVQMSYYDKPMMAGKARCYHFVHGPNEAWIDVDTKLPNSYKSGDTTYTFTFGDPPAERLTLPPEYQKTLDDVQKTTNRRRQLERNPTVSR